MTARIKQLGLVYLRRSDAKQETSLETQLEWALQEARKNDVKVDPADVGNMLAQRLNHTGSIFLDDAITGADLERPGLMRMVQEALANKQVSHVFAYKRDRLGRPDDPLPMMVLERQLTSAGITFIFGDGVAHPSRRGQTDLPHIVEMLFG